MIKTGSNSTTLFFDGAGQFWQCKCGADHRRVIDYAHHNCQHDDIIILHDLTFGYCVQCGQTVKIEDAREKQGK